MFRAAIFLMLASLFLSFMCIPSRKIQITGTAQGTTYQVVYYSVDSIVTKSEIDSILSKIDSSMSLYKSYSLINKFNNSQKGCRIDPHFKTVILKSFEIAEATNNAFDITLKPLADAWGFGVKKSATSIPNQSEIDSLKKMYREEVSLSGR